MKRVTDKTIVKELREKKRLAPSQRIYLALSEKEDAEEKLNISADLLNRVMDAPNGFYVKFKYDKTSYIYHVAFKYLTQSRVIWYTPDFYYVDNEFMPKLLTGQNGVYARDYGKTWAFTREELEDEKTKKTMEEIHEKQEAKRNDPIEQFKNSIAHLTDKDVAKLMHELKFNRKQINKAIKYNNLKYLGAVSGKFGDAVKEVSDLRKQYDLVNAKIEILKKFY